MKNKCSLLIGVFVCLFGLTFNLLSGWPAAGDKLPVTHERLWMMKRVGAPAPSPDGRWVAFSVVEPSYNAQEQSSDIWLAPADGSSSPKQITFTKAAESGLAWSPDSRQLAFSSRREGDEAAQIYLLDIGAGGEARRFTSLSTGASDPKYSPDGKRLLFSSLVYPGAVNDEASKKIATERKARKYRARVYDGFPVRMWDHWLDDMQVHVMIQEIEPGSSPVDLLAETRLAEMPGFSGAPGATSYDLQAVWTPDSQGVVFAASANRNEAAYAQVATQLYQVCSCGGEPKQLTQGEISFTHPVFSPDGKTLFALATPEGPATYSLTRLARSDWPAPAGFAPITATFDRSVGSFAVAPDSRRIYFTAEDAGLEKLYEVAASGGGEVHPFPSNAGGTYTNLAIPEKTVAPILIANWGSAVHPAEIVQVGPDGSGAKPLTAFAAREAAALDWLPVRHFEFTSKGGRRIHNLLVVPPGFDESKKYPLVVLIHGGPHSMWRDEITLRWNYHLIARPGYMVLLTNYTGSTGFGEKFSGSIQGDPLRTPGDEINQAADEAIRRFSFIDASRQAAGGASYGGHMANWLQATTTRYRCLFSHAGLINLESQWGTSDTIYGRELNNGGPVWEQGRVWREQNPIRYAASFKTPILLSVGENDFRVPLNQTLENWSVLQRLKIPSRLLVFPDANHWILKAEDSRFFYDELLGWLKKYLQ
jgi:dipeptidyl aminopeptidase/acylaminoacyl peptidase